MGTYARRFERKTVGRKNKGMKMATTANKGGRLDTAGGKGKERYHCAEVHLSITPV